MTTPRKPPTKKWRVYGPRGIIPGLGRDLRSEPEAMRAVARWNSSGYAATLQKWDNDKGLWRTVKVFQPTPPEEAPDA